MPETSQVGAADMIFIPNIYPTYAYGRMVYVFLSFFFPLFIVYLAIRTLEEQQIVVDESPGADTSLATQEEKEEETNEKEEPVIIIEQHHCQQQSLDGWMDGAQTMRACISLSYSLLKREAFVVSIKCIQTISGGERDGGKSAVY